jgi:glycosyltransferase involved in cell wall biosynthesis
VNELDHQTEYRVLIVEDLAHRPHGHSPNRFAELAQGFVENGCRVDVLTPHGWLREGEQPVPFVVSRFEPLPRLLYVIGDTLRDKWRMRRASLALRTYAQVRAVRNSRRDAGDPVPCVVVISEHDPWILSAYGGANRWLLYQFLEPDWRAFAPFVARGERAERRRRAEGGRARLAVPSEEHRGRWRHAAPFLEPITLAVAGCQPCEPVPHARRRVGVAASDKVALVFGSAYTEKDIDVVANAFSELDDWQVVVAGAVAGLYRQRRTATRDAIVIRGYVEDAMRAALYSAADLVVVSHKPSFRRDSGGLMDAVSWGVPVVCSDGTKAAALVRKYRLGLVFVSGDPDSLQQAVRGVPAAIDPADLDRARFELSNRVVARRMLEALWEPTPAG